MCTVLAGSLFDAAAWAWYTFQCIAATQSPGKTAGILIRDLDSISEHLELGFTVLAAQSDLVILRSQYQNLVSSKRNLLE